MFILLNHKIKILFKKEESNLTLNTIFTCTLEEFGDKRISLGHVGENNYFEVMVDIQEWLTSYPDAIINAVYERPDGDTYIVDTSIISNNIIWKPSLNDMKYEGSGKLQLVLTDSSTIGKSKVATVLVKESIPIEVN